VGARRHAARAHRGVRAAARATPGGPRPVSDRRPAHRAAIVHAV